MKDDLNKLNDEVSQYIRRLSKVDEKLFNYGVELGRLLEKNNIADYRLPIFVEQEVAKNLAQKKQAVIEKARKLLMGIVINAYKAELDENGAISIDASRHSARNETHLSDEIVSRYSLKHTGTQQHNTGGDFTLTFLLLGKLQEIFQRHSISPQFEVSANNNSGEEDETLYEPEDIESAFYSLNIGVNSYNTDLSVEQLEAFVDDLNKYLLFAVIKGS
jgi:hypothetical protein